MIFGHSKKKTLYSVLLFMFTNKYIAHDKILFILSKIFCNITIAIGICNTMILCLFYRRPKHASPTHYNTIITARYLIFTFFKNVVMFVLTILRLFPALVHVLFIQIFEWLHIPLSVSQSMISNKVYSNT